ncbi:MAG: hypothetical protein M9926_06060 [Lentimicrobium sp.]|jgi:hypothetical protein|uniref:hypothetical protein n=1 Tax=Lentimicrobium sp. TaxID=2034841 RepID=UPI0025E348A3|nr:hypothetical protein [Lentimicrobium sp.]MCO5256309.1 hypothetical protein [Lentimicrobium sp.]
METKYAKCQKCPAYHLLDEQRKRIIEKWEYKREKYVSRMKQVRLILLGESMPANRYFYDLETEYKDGGLRYTLKKEFGRLDIDDSLFLQSLTRKGIALFDCALCPIYLLEDNVAKRAAATHCLLTINQTHTLKYPEVPIATIFPSRRGFLKTEIPPKLLNRVVGEFSFSDQTGLSELYENVKQRQLLGE